MSRSKRQKTHNETNVSRSNGQKTRSGTNVIQWKICTNSTTSEARVVGSGIQGARQSWTPRQNPLEGTRCEILIKAAGILVMKSFPKLVW